MKILNYNVQIRLFCDFKKIAGVAYEMVFSISSAQIGALRTDSLSPDQTAIYIEDLLPEHRVEESHSPEDLEELL